MHFYELHEGEDDVFFDVMLFREDDMDAEEFFTVVQSIRRQVQDSFETDTLVEAIAQELERQYGFVFVSDDRLTAAVNVSKIDDDNFLADLDGEDPDDDTPRVIGDADYRGVYAAFEPPDADLN
ncbi:MAG: hypothetical protein V4515_02525 [Chloroflexota bacterium]